MSDPSYNRNPGTFTDAYAESVYAFLASGGFVLERGFAKIKAHEWLDPYVDVTNAVQIMMSVDLFNQKLGKFKPEIDAYDTNTITITASDIVNSLKKGAQVLSTGAYSTLYSDFASYVSTYFGNVGGFSSLFDGASEFAIDVTNEFNGDSLIRLFNGEQQDASGQYISDLSGSITVSSIRELLLWAIDSNALGNRDPAVKNWGLGNGFVEGDIIWIEEGTKIILNLGIDNERFNPINNIGPSNTETLNQTTTYENGLFSSYTTSSTTYITRTVTAPLLIKLVSYSTIESLPPFGGVDISGVVPDADPADVAEIDPSMNNTNPNSQPNPPPSTPSEPIIPVSLSNFIILGTTTSGTSYVTSPDATWTLNGNTTALKSAASSGSNYFAVGAPLTSGSSTVVKSLDGGVTWRLALNSPFSTSGNDVLFIGNTIVACGSGGNTLAYVTGATDTPQGNTWTTVDTGLTSGTQLFYDSVEPRLYVVGSGSNTMSFASSPSGTWTGLGKYVFADETTTIHGPATYTNPRTWIAVGQGGTALTYGTSGTAFTANITSPLTSAAAVAHGADLNGVPVWVAGGQGTNTLAFSRNPSSGWTGLGATVLSTSCKSVAYGVDASGTNLWLAAGAGATNTLAFSKNPITAAGWSGLGKTLFTTGYSVACGKDASGNALWMAAGAGTAHTLAFSRNPTVAGSWTGLGKTMFSTVGFSIAYGQDCSGNPIWIAAGQDDAGANNALAYSRDPTDPTKWFGLGSTALSIGQGVAFGSDGSGNPIWLAVGSGVSTVAYSRNPTVANAWTGISTGLPSSSGYSVSYGVDASGQSLWVVGQLTTNTIIYSNFPTVAGSWAKPAANMFSIMGGGFAQERTPKYIAGGACKNGFMGSFDGLTWYPLKSPFTVATHDVYWSQEQQLWVAVGEGTHTLAHSINGIEWEGHGLSVFTVRGKKVTYSAADSKWYATGEGTYTAASSIDGHDWIPTGTTTPIPVPINSDNLVLMGTTSAGASSAAPLNSYVITEDNAATTINAIAFDGTSTYYAGGTGTNNLVKSTDGGASWYSVTSPFTTSVTDIVFAGGNTVVAAGTGTNKLAYNSGSGWAPVNNGQTSVSQLFYDAAAPRIYSAGVGANTLSFASSAGNTWTGLGTYVFNGGVNTIHGPCNPVGGRLWVAGGNNSNGGGNTLATSGNIQAGTWTGLLTSTFSTSTSGIAYGTDAAGAPIWVAVGSGTANTLAYSYTPSTSWTGLGTTAVTANANKIAYGLDGSGNAIWVAVSSGTNKIVCSTNPPVASSWTPVVISIFTTQGFNVEYGKDASGNPLWIACGNGTNTFAYSYYPSVASSWTALTIPAFANAIRGNCLKYGTDCSGNPIWMAGIAIGTATHTMAYSRNPVVGSSWVGLGKTLFSTIVTALEFGTDASGAPIWLAGGGTVNIMAFSRNPTDAASWTGFGTSILSSLCSKISYGLTTDGKPFWTAAGTGTNSNSIAYSTKPDASANWSFHNTTFLTGSTMIVQERIPKYIAGSTGMDNMSGSIDGQTWFDIKSPFSSATNDVFWSPQQNRWVAVGEGGNTVAYSSNGIQWTGLGTTVFGLYGKNITYSAAESKWYAAGYSLIGGLTTATSSNGITWTAIAVTYANGGSEPLVVTNYTLLGSSSTPLTSPTATLTFDKYSSTINTVAIDGSTNTTYAGATGSVTVATSTDGGNTWAAIASPFSTATNDIVVAGSQVVATGSGGNTLAYYDGALWTSVNTGLTTGNNLYYDVSGARVYAMGTGANTLAFSSTPVSTSGWTGLGTYVFANGANTMHGPCNPAGGRLWVAGGAGGNSLAASGNLEAGTWTGLSMNIFTTVTNAISYGTDSTGAPLWGAVGEGTSNTLAFSSSPSTLWTGLGKTAIPGIGNGIAYGIDASGNAVWVAVGSGTNKIVCSTNPTNAASWTPVGTTVLTTLGMCVEYGKDAAGTPLWMVGGAGTNYIVYSYFPTVASSWTGISLSLFAGAGQCNSLKYGSDCSGNPIWMAGMATGTSVNAFAYSRNPILGSSWVGLGATIFTTNVRTIEFGTDASGVPLWMVGGRGNTHNIAYSYNPTDAASWIGLGKTIMSYTCLKLTCGINAAGKTLWATAGNNTNFIAYSTNPIDAASWTFHDTTITNVGYSIIQELIPKYIAGGSGIDNMRGSIDGQTWFTIKSPFSTATNDVFWSSQQNRWVAVGEGGNTVAHSSNGIQWTGIGTTIFSVRGNKVTYDVSDNRWYALGDGTLTMFISSDGKYWVKYPASTTYPNIILLGISSTSKSFSNTSSAFTWTGQNLFTIGRSIAYDGNATYYAVGDGTNTMQRSTDNGNTWSVVTSPFTTSGRDIMYAGTQWVSCGYGTNTLAYFNGTSWIPVDTGLTQGIRLYYEPNLQRTYVMGSGSNTMSYASSVSGTWTGLGKYVFNGGAITMNGPANYNTNKLWIAGSLGNSPSNTTGFITNPLNTSSWTSTRNIFNYSTFTANIGVDGNGNTIYVIGGQNASPGGNLLAYSYTPTILNSWTKITGNTYGTAGCLNVAFGPTNTGSPLWIASLDTSGCLLSYDAINWSRLLIPNNFTYSMDKISHGFDISGNYRWIACSQGELITSTNPVNAASWIRTTIGKFSTQMVCEYGLDHLNNPIWVATGNGTNAIAYSYTPSISASWVALGKPTGFTAGTRIVFGFDISNNPIWMISGAGTTFKVLYSFTPTIASSWTGLGITDTNPRVSYTIDVSNNPLWIIGSNGNFLYSKTPSIFSSWTKITTSTLGYSGSFSLFSCLKPPVYISGGVNTATMNVNMKGSLDGQTWYYIPSPFTAATYDVYWSQSHQLWVAVGEGTNTVAYSSNGLSWTGLGTTIFSTRGRKIAFSTTQNMWFIAGEGTNTLAASYDGKTWMPITSTTGYVDQIGMGLSVK